MMSRRNLIEYLCQQTMPGWRELPEAAQDSRRLTVENLLQELESLEMVRPPHPVL